jgi:hypothetical protein
MPDETGTRRRKPQARIGEGGRRLQSAGAAIAVTLGALLLSLLLNAPGLHKSAQIQPEGWKRDVALGVTGPLESVSAALLLDLPRRALKSALGRSGDDEIDTEVAAPEDPEEPAAPPPGPRARERFSPDRKLRLWIAGDSLVVVPGESLLREAGENPALEAVGRVDGRIASGLERPDVFNWFRHVRDAAQETRAGAIVLMFGGNDDHGFMTGVPEGVEIGDFGSPGWTEEYRRRVRAVMDSATRSGAYLVWIGLPVTKDAEQTRRFDTINAIVQSEAAKRPRRVSYVDTYFFFAGADGGFAQYVSDESGKLVKMRADDGVHFERAAGDRIASEVLRRLEQRYDITSWRKSP